MDHSLKSCTFYKNKQWFHSNSSTRNFVEYVIEKARQEDEGFYSCVCYTEQNQRLEESSPAPLIVTAFQEWPHLELIPHLRKYDFGSKVTMECSSNSDSSYTQCWFYNFDVFIGHRSNSSAESPIQYVISNVTVNDRGVYSCVCYTAQHRITYRSKGIILYTAGTLTL
ncbi:contactin-6-like [Protopterus annectens]|uniref:contactin-6-like n=1 Tax=Protopterus annectens TaxID=7888 RepID=UPI001CFAA6F4|nr:contactin-6-like [Protopterus annectens]